MSLSFLARGLVVCWGVSIAGLAAVSAQTNLIPQGGEYALTGSLPGDQILPQVAVDSNGGYLVWQDNSVSPLGLRIRAQRLGSVWTATGAPFVVSSVSNSKNTGDQERPQVALLSGGGAVIVWQGGKAGNQQIYARFVNSTGSLSGSDIRVGSHAKNNQENASVTVLADGSVVIVWASYGQDGDRLGIFGQRFSSTGRKLGTEFQINQFYWNNQRTPSVAALAGGGFVVAWVSELQRGSGTVDIYARIFDSSGVAVGSEFPVNTSLAKPCANPAAAGSPEGGFLIAWSQNDNVVSTGGSVNGVWVNAISERSTNSWDVFGRLYDQSGTPKTSPFTLNTHTYGDQYVPKVSPAGSNFVAVWTSLGQDGSMEGVFGQLISSDGDFEGSEFQANSTTLSRQIQPVVTSDGTRVLITWSSYVVGAINFDLFARQFELAP